MWVPAAQGNRHQTPPPTADHRIVWRRNTTNPAVTALIDIIREPRNTAFLPPEVPYDPDESHHSTATDGTKPD